MEYLNILSGLFILIGMWNSPQHECKVEFLPYGEAAEEAIKKVMFFFDYFLTLNTLARYICPL